MELKISSLSLSDHLGSQLRSRINLPCEDIGLETRYTLPVRVFAMNLEIGYSSFLRSDSHVLCQPIIDCSPAGFTVGWRKRDRRTMWALQYKELHQNFRVPNWGKEACISEDQLIQMQPSVTSQFLNLGANSFSSR